MFAVVAFTGLVLEMLISNTIFFATVRLSQTPEILTKLIRTIVPVCISKVCYTLFMSDLYQKITSLVTQNLKTFKSRVQTNTRVFEGIRFFCTGQGSFRNVFCVWVGDELQDFVVKVNKTKLNCNKFESDNFNVIREDLEQHWMLVPVLHFESDILFMERVEPFKDGDDFRKFIQESFYIIDTLKEFFLINRKLLPASCKEIQDYDVRAQNMSQNFKLLDYGVPLVRIN